MTLLRTRTVSIAALAFCVALIPSAAAPQQQAAPAATSELVLTIDPSQSKVHWMVDSTLHTVHGTFALKSGTLHFNPQTGKAGGEIIVYAPSGESGNGSRDKRMHKEILETEKYPEVVFRPQQVEGSVPRSGASDVKLSGVFSIHGADHPLTAEVHANLSGDHWTGTGKFQVPYITWGIKDPSNFLLKVKPVVDVELELSGALKNVN
jgi:polyisoprenoid-binding protein YceI